VGVTQQICHPASRSEPNNLLLRTPSYGSHAKISAIHQPGGSNSHVKAFWATQNLLNDGTSHVRCNNGGYYWAYSAGTPEKSSWRTHAASVYLEDGYTGR